MRRRAKESSVTSAAGAGAGRRDATRSCRLSLRMMGAPICAVAAFALLFASSASAFDGGQIFSTSFGSSGTGNGQFAGGSGSGVAIDQSNGNVYVADPGHSRIQKFDSEGNFLAAWGFGVLDGSNESQVCNAPAACQVGLPGNAPGQFQYPTAIAVDNSGGPNAGAVYVADTGGSGDIGGQPGLGYILKFDQNGNFLRKIDGTGTPGGVFGSLPWNGAISVDGQGFLWVTTGERVMKFSNANNNAYVGGSEWTRNGVFGIAANEAGDRLLVLGFVGGNYGSYVISSNGTAPGEGLGCGTYFGGNMAYDSGTGHWFVGNSTSVCEFTEDEELAFGSPFGGTNPGRLNSVAGIAINATTGKVYVYNHSQQKVHIFIPKIVPDVTTDPATNVGHTSATLHGQVAPDPTGGGDVTGCNFQYMDAAELELYEGLGISRDLIFEVLSATAPCAPATPYAAPTAVTADLAGLTMEQRYAYRLLASNSIGTNAGAVRTFTPHAVIGTETEDATNITQTAATLRGSFDPDNENTNYYFEWGTDTSYGNVTAVPPGDDGGSAPGLTPVSTDIEGLSAFTTYHYRIVATNSIGTSHGEDRVFRTLPPEPPQVSETAVTDVAPGQATVSAEITPGFGATVFLFEYGPTAAYGKTTEMSDSIGSDNSPHTVEADLKGLAPGVTYHVRAVAINFGGTGHGAEATFTTPSAPAIGAGSTSDVTQTTATLRTQIHPGLSPTTYHFEYGLTPSYGLSTPESAPIGSDASYHEVAASIGSLAPGTTYHFRAVATNAVGTISGPDQVFRTQDPPAASQAPQETSAPTKCRKGFVRRGDRCVRRRCKKGFARKGGKCVKRKAKQRKRRKSNQRRGSRSHG